MLQSQYLKNKVYLCRQKTRGIYAVDMSIKCDCSSYNFTIVLFPLASYILVRKKLKITDQKYILSYNHIVFIQIIYKLYFFIPRQYDMSKFNHQNYSLSKFVELLNIVQRRSKLNQYLVIFTCEWYRIICHSQLCIFSIPETK